jgi:hypothetical protein
MSRFTFKRGAWEDGNSLPEWKDDEDFGAYLERIGHASSKTMFGHEDGGHIEIYESSDGRSFYATVCPSGGSVHEVFLPDFPSMMMFVKDYGTPFSAESVNFRQQESLALLEKSFELKQGNLRRHTQ